jgi:hypothetical protein
MPRVAVGPGLRVAAVAEVRIAVSDFSSFD